MNESEIEIKIENEWSRKIEDYIQSLDLDEELDSYVKDLIASNVRAYAKHLRNNIDESYIFINNFNRMKVLKLISDKDGRLITSKEEDNKR